MTLTLEKLQNDYANLESLTLSSLTQQTTRVRTTHVGADLIGISYDGMPGNQPNDYQNYIALWPNDASIPWNADPEQVQLIDSNRPSDDTVFHNLDVTNNSYIIGYAVGPKLSPRKQLQGNICSFVTVPSIGSAVAPETFEPSLTMTHVGTNSVAARFNLPTGIQPQTNGAWVGIWRAARASYSNAPEASAAVIVDAGQGDCFINGVTIRRGQTYTMAFFTSGWNVRGKHSNQHRMACSVTFTN